MSDEQRSASSPNIFQRMMRATAEINRVAKNLKVDISARQSYKAVAEADVLEAVKPIEEKYGIYSYPYSRDIIKDEVITNKSEYDGRTTEKSTLFMRIKTVYRFINTDDPQDFIDITTYGDGVDAQDKAPGKAMTYADKYALLKAYKIQTGEDLDAEASKDIRAVSNAQKTPSKAQKPQDAKLPEADKNKPLTLKEAMQEQIEIKGVTYRLGALREEQLDWIIGKAEGRTKEAAEIIRREKFKSALENEQGEIPFN